jgi:hypothetical protein
MADIYGARRIDKYGDVLDPSYDIKVWSTGKYAPIIK